MIFLYFTVYFANQEFRGSVDFSTPVEVIFPTPIEARFLRILPRSWINNMAITVDVLGCSVEEQTEAISYNIQTPDTVISGITQSLNVDPTANLEMEEIK